MYQAPPKQGWFARSKWVGSAVVWLLIIGFVANWIYAYDACKAAATNPDPQIGCLVVSLFGTYFAWLITAIAWFVKLVMILL